MGIFLGEVSYQPMSWSAGPLLPSPSPRPGRPPESEELLGWGFVAKGRRGDLSL